MFARLARCRANESESDGCRDIGDCVHVSRLAADTLSLPVRSVSCALLLTLSRAESFSVPNGLSEATLLILCTLFPKSCFRCCTPPLYRQYCAQQP
eukprot:1288936-Rhodomonas_salina.1